MTDATLFATPGNAKEVKLFKDMLHEGKDIDFHGVSPAVVADLLKLWLRHMPDSLIPGAMYPRFVKAVNDKGKYLP